MVLMRSVYEVSTSHQAMQAIENTQVGEIIDFEFNLSEREYEQVYRRVDKMGLDFEDVADYTLRLIKKVEA